MGNDLWLDAILASPTIGVRSVSDFKLGLALPAAAIPIVERVAQRSKLKPLNVELAKTVIELENGLRLTVSSDGCIVEHSYQIQAVTEAGRFPVLNPPEVRPYSELVREAKELIGVAVETLWGDEAKAIVLIGLIANCGIPLDAAPPGLNQAVARMGDIWGGSLMKSASEHLVKLSGDAENHTRCHYVVKFDRTRSDSMEFRLDWQSVYSGTSQMNASQAIDAIDKTVDRALEHFQSVAEGK